MVKDTKKALCHFHETLACRIKKILLNTKIKHPRQYSFVNKKEKRMDYKI